MDWLLGSTTLLIGLLIFSLSIFDKWVSQSPCLPRPPRMQPSERLRVADDTIDADIGDDDWQQVPVGTHGGIGE